MESVGGRFLYSISPRRRQGTLPLGAIAQVYFSLDKLLPTQTIRSVHRLNDDVNDTGHEHHEPPDETLAYNYYSSNLKSMACPRVQRVTH